VIVFVRGCFKTVVTAAVAEMIATRNMDKMVANDFMITDSYEQEIRFEWWF
jgi:hypothetical protein